MNMHNACGLLDGPDTSGKYRLCPYPWCQMAIGWNGDVVACCRDIEGQTILGNVLQKNILDVWNSSGYRRVRAALANKKPEAVAACRNCDMPWSSSNDRWRPMRILQQLLGTSRKKAFKQLESRVA